MEEVRWREWLHPRNRLGRFMDAPGRADTGFPPTESTSSWKPGEWGRGILRGLVGDDPIVHLWPEEWATHSRMADDLGVELGDDAIGFDVYPEGDHNLGDDPDEFPPGFVAEVERMIDWSRSHNTGRRDPGPAPIGHRWMPGSWGKGWLWPDGTVETWNVDRIDGGPYHVEVGKNRPEYDPERPGFLSLIDAGYKPFAVEPDGRVHFDRAFGRDRDAVTPYEATPDDWGAVARLDGLHARGARRDPGPARGGHRWLPGRPGKGWLSPSGLVTTWNTDRAGSPHHDEVADAEKVDLDNLYLPFVIDEDGEVESEYPLRPAQWEAITSEDGLKAPRGMFRRDPGPTQTGPIIDVGDDVQRAADLLGEGRRVRLHQPRQVCMLLDVLAERAKEAERLGADAPNYNLCDVIVRETDLFCVRSKGLKRIKMPQLDNMEDAFKQRLRERGVKLTFEQEKASYLRPTQIELSGVRVAQHMHELRDGTYTLDAPLFVSSDNYILDGHHRWAAHVGIDVGDNKLHDVDMDVVRIDMEITELLEIANEFVDEQGRARIAMMEAGWRDWLHPRNRLGRFIDAPQRMDPGPNITWRRGRGEWGRGFIHKRTMEVRAWPEDWGTHATYTREHGLNSADWQPFYIHPNGDVARSSRLTEDQVWEIEQALPEIAVRMDPGPAVVNDPNIPIESKDREALRDLPPSIERAHWQAAPPSTGSAPTIEAAIAQMREWERESAFDEYETYAGEADFFAQHGRAYENYGYPEFYDEFKGEMGQCFQNTLMMAVANPELTYVEGFAIPAQSFFSIATPMSDWPLGLPHAWLVDKEGQVIDPTWHDPDGVEYFGVPIPTDVATEMALQRGYYGVLQDPDELGLFDVPWDETLSAYGHGHGHAEEARYDEKLHPRNRLGRWIKKIEALRPGESLRGEAPDTFVVRNVPEGQQALLHEPPRDAAYTVRTWTDTFTSDDTGVAARVLAGEEHPYQGTLLDEREANALIGGFEYQGNRARVTKFETYRGLVSVGGAFVDELDIEFGRWERQWSEREAVHGWLHAPGTPRGLGAAFSRYLEENYPRYGIEEIRLETTGVGGYVWAKEGYEFDESGISSASHLFSSRGYEFLELAEDEVAAGRYTWDDVRDFIERFPGVSMSQDWPERWEARHLTDDKFALFDELTFAGTYNGDFYDPWEIAMHGVEDAWQEGDHKMWIGKQFMRGSTWHGVKYLPGHINAP